MVGRGCGGVLGAGVAAQMNRRRSLGRRPELAPRRTLTGGSSQIQVIGWFGDAPNPMGLRMRGQQA